MATPLLKTKTHAPRIKSELVQRPRLTERLADSLEGKLILISAPAGFGKTTLITEWIQDLEKPVGWISLDQGDNDITRFLGYIVLALQGMKEDFGVSILEMIHSPQRPPMEHLLTTLINEAVEVLDPFMLILDDYHVIGEKNVHDAMSFFLDHLPPNTQVVLSTRSDPPWPLARLRARGEMVEIRARDLRFTTQEATQFLNVTMGLDLSVDDIQRLEARTEGWVVGLQMAALSMRGKRDASEFIAVLSGSHRFILDYLMEEVLEQEPVGIQEFLLRTSILERMSAPLCDVLAMELEHGDWGIETEERDVSDFQGSIDHLQSPISSQRILEYLEQNNLFVIPLDEERVWYRYHHLFSDLLRTRLQQRNKGLLLNLYEAASRWCEEQDFIMEAVKYALLGEKFERAADLIEEHAEKMIEYGESPTLLAWINELPEENLQGRLWLRVHCAKAMTQVGQLDAAEEAVRKVERTLSERAAFDSAEARHLRSHLVSIRANLAEIRGDRLLAVQLAEEALELLPPSDLKMKSSLLMLRSFSLQWSGNFEEATKSSEEAVAISKEIGNLRISVAALNDLVALRIYQGRLHEALAACEQALEVVRESRERKQGLLLQSEGITYYYMSRIFLEWNDLSAAMDAVSKGMELSKQGGGIDIGVVGSVDLIRTLLAFGELEKAQETISKVKNSYPELASVRLPAIEAKVLVAMGDFGAARQLIERAGVSSQDDPDFNQLLMQRILARALVREGKYQEALDFLHRLKVFTEEKKVTRNTIEILILQAIALHGMGEEDQAIDALKEALILGKPEGFVRSFINEGETIGKLLRKLKECGVEVGYATKLLDELEKERVRKQISKDVSAPSVESTQASLVEPLTERELQVLRLLRTDLSVPEIADTLFVAVSTVRSHTKSIYNKLEVHGRAQAVARAEELGLV